MAMQTIDVDQHLFESRTTWSEHIDPAHRSDALSITDDEGGWPWLTWRERRLTPLEVPIPERSSLIGDDRLRRLRGERAPASFEELVPDAYRLSRGAARLPRRVRARRRRAVPQLRTAVGAAAGLRPRGAARQRAGLQPFRGRPVCQEGQDRLFGVAHVLLHDPAWAVEEIAPRAGRRRPPGHGRPGARGREAAVAPGLRSRVGRLQRSRVSRPVFHVSEFESPLHPAWRQGEQEDGEQLFDSIFLYMAPAIALANLILNGVLERFPHLRIGVVELDGELGPALPPPHRRRVRLLHPAARRALPQAGRAAVDLLPAPGPGGRAPVRDAEPPRARVGDDTFMIGSDWPHAEGVADPMAAAERAVAGLTGPGP